MGSSLSGEVGVPEESPTSRMDAIEELRKKITKYNTAYTIFVHNMIFDRYSDSDGNPPTLPDELQKDNVLRKFMEDATAEELCVLYDLCGKQNTAIEERRTLRQSVPPRSHDVDMRLKSLEDESFRRTNAFGTLLNTRCTIEVLDAVRERKIEELIRLQQVHQTELEFIHVTELKNLEIRQETQRKQLSQTQIDNMDEVLNTRYETLNVDTADVDK